MPSRAREFEEWAGQSRDRWQLAAGGEPFAGFGQSQFVRNRQTPVAISLDRDRRMVRSRLRVECPAAPGVYGMIDHAGRLIYVGVSCRLRDRLLSYFQGTDALESLSRTRREEGQRKELRIARRAVQLTWEVAGHELVALLREHELIRRFLPDLNVRGRRRRRLAYIHLTNEAAPRFRVAAKLPKSCRHHWGPFAHNHQLARSVELLNRQFRLADCPSQTPFHFADEASLFPIVDRPLCLRGEVERCLAPCASATTRGEYFAQLARARAFLAGDDDTMLRELAGELTRAIAERQFEQAARLHEIRTALESLRDRIVPMPATEPHCFVYPLRQGRRRSWMLVAGSAVLALRLAPRDQATATRWLARLSRLADQAEWSLDDRDAGESRIIRAWFRQHPNERNYLLSCDTARELCRKMGGN